MRARVTVLILLAGAALRADVTETLDHLDEALTYASPDDAVRAHLTGLADAELYEFQQQPPGLIRSPGDALFTPRLSLFLDAQAGAHVYVFSQFRVDRGFDPSNGPLRGRLDEYAVRLMPGTGRPFSLQLGKFATVIGNWAPRHDSWTDAFVTAPLPYDNLTAVWDALPARSPGILLAWAHLRPFPPGDADTAKQLRMPIIWGPSYATGAAATGAFGTFTYAVEVKNASLSSRPYDWQPTERGWNDPTVSGRLGYRPSPTWSFGVSGSEGSYLSEDAAAALPSGQALSDYRQIVFGQDAAFAHHHFQAWAEIYEARFAIPLVGNADTVAWYIEIRQTLAPQWFAALRWNQQLYGDIPFAGGQTPWGADVWRADAALGHRFTPRLQAKVQYSAQQDGGVSHHNLGHTLALQLTARL